MNKIVASTLSPAPETGAEDLQQMLKWFDITDDDRKLLAGLRDMTEVLADSVIDAFYDHIMDHPKSAAHFADDATLKRVKAAQKRYFNQLASGEIDPGYVMERRRIGQVHEHVGITPSLYMGGYSFYLNKVGMEAMHRLRDDPANTMRMLLALMKVAQFDMALALETYVDSREQTIRDREREMQELATPVLKLKEGLLLVPVVGTLDSHRAGRLTLDLLEGVRDHRAHVVVLDITGMSDADSAVTNHLIRCMDAAELMGVKAILTGISVDLAQSLVKIGLKGENLRTAGDLKRGLEFAENLLKG